MPVTDDTARRFVADHYGGRAGTLHALGAGEWSRAYAFVLDGREVVIRFGGYAEDFRKDQAMAAHSRAALRIPAIIEMVPRRTAISPFPSALTASCSTASTAPGCVPRCRAC